MKYFTKEIWARHNDHTDQTVIEEGDRNMQEYVRQFEALRPRLSEITHRFFTAENLHDGRLLAFVGGDNINFDPIVEKYDINAVSTSVQLKVLGPHLDTLFTLQYTDVRRALFDYPTDQPLFHSEGSYIGDWGYDELTSADDKYLRHEVLFASGTTILIEFKEFNYEKVQVG